MENPDPLHVQGDIETIAQYLGVKEDNVKAKKDECPMGGQHAWTEWSYAVYPGGRRMCEKCAKVEID